MLFVESEPPNHFLAGLKPVFFAQLNFGFNSFAHTPTASCVIFSPSTSPAVMGQWPTPTQSSRGLSRLLRSKRTLRWRWPGLLESPWVAPIPSAIYFLIAWVVFRSPALNVPGFVVRVASMVSFATVSLGATRTVVACKSGLAYTICSSVNSSTTASGMRRYGSKLKSALSLARSYSVFRAKPEPEPEPALNCTSARSRAGRLAPR